MANPMVMIHHTKSPTGPLKMPLMVPPRMQMLNFGHGLEPELDHHPSAEFHRDSNCRSFKAKTPLIGLNWS